MSSNPTGVRILWVTPKFPLGTPDGARHATRSLIRQLTHKGVQIDLVSLVPSGESADESMVIRELGLQRCFIIRRSGSRWWPLPTLSIPWTFRTFAAPSVRQAFAAELERYLKSLLPQDKAFVVFDGLHTFAAFDSEIRSLSSQGVQVIYRAHNVETVLWEQCADRAKTPWFRWFFRFQAQQVSRFERTRCSQVDRVAPVSEEDAQKFRRLAPQASVSVTRIGMDFPSPESLPMPKSQNQFEVLFVGRLDWLPNRLGLQWFLDNVWPKVHAHRPALRLTVAGMGNGEWLQKYVNLSGLRILGRVDDVEPLYHECNVCIAPIFQGSGTRVKIIESARFMRPVISTTLGAEGSGLIPGVSFFQAENEGEWIQCLQTVTVEDCRRVGSEAYRQMRQNFDGHQIAMELLRVLQGVSSHS